MDIGETDIIRMKKTLPVPRPPAGAGEYPV
jgi:hypothetical protein